MTAAAQVSNISVLPSCWGGVLFSGAIVGAGCLELRTLIYDLKCFFAEISKIIVLCYWNNVPLLGEAL